MRLTVDNSAVWQSGKRGDQISLFSGDEMTGKEPIDVITGTFDIIMAH